MMEELLSCGDFNNAKTGRNHRGDRIRNLWFDFLGIFAGNSLAVQKIY